MTSLEPGLRFRDLDLDLEWEWDLDLELERDLDLERDRDWLDSGDREGEWSRRDLGSLGGAGLENLLKKSMCVKWECEG